MNKISVCILMLLLTCCLGSVSAQTATIDADNLQQNIRGFGGANIIGWRDDLTSSQRVTAFSVEDGLGLSICRVRVSPNSADWELEKDTINAAKANGALVIATSWTAPTSMKTNNSDVGGNLKTSSYAAYAAHLRDFVETVGGVDAISPVNEPNYRVDYESMEMSAYDVASFVAAQGDNCGAPIMAPEPFNMSSSFFDQYLSNSAARAKTTYLAGHIYGARPYLYRNAGDMEVWMTEHYVDSSADANDWGIAMRAAREIHDCMYSGYSAYVWWYLCRYYGPIDEDGHATKTGYVMSNYAKYVRPGYRKIACTVNPSSGVYITAYKYGTNLVIVAINQNSSSVNQSFRLNGISVSGLDSYTTTRSANHTHSTVSASGSSFNVSLAGSSVTTIVSGGGSTPPPTTPPPTDGDIMIRARGTVGGERMELQLDGESVSSWTLSTNYQNFYADGSGSVLDVLFTNDDQQENGMDIQVDYIEYLDTVYQAEEQEINTGVYQDDSCGGSYSEMLQCDGYIRFNVSGPTPSPTPYAETGDVNDDGKITVIDALMVAQSSVGLNPPNFFLSRADINCDGKITIVDALVLAQYTVGAVDSIGC